MRRSKPFMGALQAVPVTLEPFEPGLKEWVVFGLIVAVIVLIYVVRYLLSNRQKHKYIRFTEEESDSSGGSS